MGEEAQDVRATDDSERNSNEVYYFKNKTELNQALELRAFQHSQRQKREDKLNI